MPKWINETRFDVAVGIHHELMRMRIERMTDCPGCDLHTPSCGAEDFCCLDCPNLRGDE